MLCDTSLRNVKAARQRILNSKSRCDPSSAALCRRDAFICWPVRFWCEGGMILPGVFQSLEQNLLTLFVCLLGRQEMPAMVLRTAMTMLHPASGARRQQVLREPTVPLCLQRWLLSAGSDISMIWGYRCDDHGRLRRTTRRAGCG